MHHHAASALAIALDVDAWAGAAAGPGATRVLGQQGWRAVALGPSDRLDTVWQDLGRTSTASHRSRGVHAGPVGATEPVEDGVAL
jgi:hypothetical protein